MVHAFGSFFVRFASHMRYHSLDVLSLSFHVQFSQHDHYLRNVVTPVHQVQESRRRRFHQAYPSLPCSVYGHWCYLRSTDNMGTVGNLHEE